ncbi:carbohydrate ABC transporter permease [Actinoallomurus sp. CA-142502]|uniref:carbohydrate ABC transporter permease n=1 Tax=Actinoallomurus sp. CA-142502 TaxID=3239885 RepID=UPI003D90236A
MAHQTAQRSLAGDVPGGGDRRQGLAFVVPALLLVTVFLILPALWTLYLGLTDYRLTGVQAAHPKVVGTANYTHALGDKDFRDALGRTLLFVLGSAIIGQNVLGFLLAWTLRSTPLATPRRPRCSARRWARALVETLVLLAWILPGVVVAWLWIAFLKDQGGTLNAILHTPGRDWWFDHPMGSLIAFNVWRGTAFSMMLFTAALSSVPPSQLESARLAGASGWQQLRDVVLPGIRGHILTNTLLISLWTFNDFTPYLITKGEPHGASAVLPVYIYLTALPGERLGFASAISLIMLVINLLLALAYIRILRRRA